MDGRCRAGTVTGVEQVEQSASARRTMSTQFGWEHHLETSMARIVADFAAGHHPDREWAWIGERDG